MAFAQTPATIEVDGKQRPTTNSNGQPIHPTEEGHGTLEVVLG